MTWNWQKPDWPGFSWDQTLLRKAEEHFLMGSGMFVGTIRHLGAIDQEQFTIEAISLEALTAAQGGGSRAGSRTLSRVGVAWGSTVALETVFPLR